MKKLIIADIALLLCSKLAKLPAALFAFLAKIPIIGKVFGLISKMFLLFGKFLIIPFYVLTAVLTVMLLLKLIKRIKKKKAQKIGSYDLPHEQTSAEYARERNKEFLRNGEPDRMNIFKD